MSHVQLEHVSLAPPMAHCGASLLSGLAILSYDSGWSLKYAFLSILHFRTFVVLQVILTEYF